MSWHLIRISKVLSSSMKRFRSVKVSIQAIFVSLTMKNGPYGKKLWPTLVLNKTVPFSYNSVNIQRDIISVSMSRLNFAFLIPAQTSVHSKIPFTFHRSFPFSITRLENPVFEFILRFNEFKWWDTELCGLWTLLIDYFEFITYEL